MRFYTDVKLFIILICPCLLLLNPLHSFGFSGLKVSVDVIKADRTSKVIDPELEDLSKELSDVLNYSGFSLIKKAIIQLNPLETGDVILSSGRVLKLEFLEFENDQARLLVRILEESKETFRTTLLLVDKGSILIGGPPHEGGVLLLRVGAEFR